MSANPIQCFDKKLTAIVWMLTCKGAQKWPLQTVDQLHKEMQSTDRSGRGFFTLPELVGKSHSTSVLHLVMERDTAKDVARIFAMMPVSKAEIKVVDTNPAPSTKGVQKKRPAVQKKHAKKKLPAGGDQHFHGGAGAEAPAKRPRLSDCSQTGAPAPAPGSPLVPPSLPGPPTRRHSAEADDGLSGTWHSAKRRKHLMTQDSDEGDDGEELRNLRWQVEELKLAKAGWRQRSEERAEAGQQLLIQVQALRLELSNVKTELESAHRKAAAEGSVRQKETEDAKEAQLEGAKRIRELEEKLHDEVERLKKELAAASSKATILKSYHSTS